MFSQVEHAVGIAPFVVIPRNDLVEVFVEGNACMLVKH
jgi:hypothetical protein